MTTGVKRCHRYTYTGYRSTHLVHTATSNKPTSFVDLTITGNLVVQGTKTELSTTTLDVEDKNITMSKGSIEISNFKWCWYHSRRTRQQNSLIYNDNPEKWVFNKTPYFGKNRLLTDHDVGTGCKVLTAILLTDNMGHTILTMRLHEYTEKELQKPIWT